MDVFLTIRHGKMLVQATGFEFPGPGRAYPTSRRDCLLSEPCRDCTKSRFEPLPADGENLSDDPEKYVQ